MNHVKRLLMVIASPVALVVLTSRNPAPAASPDQSTPTFTRDIAPIMYGNCVSCHRPDEVGPFSLLNYQDVKKRAKQIASVTGDHLMPPWKPDAGFGEFKFARTMTDVQIATISKWVEGGAPEGNAADLPIAPKFPEGWQLDKPDLILKAKNPFTVPAEGPDIYVHFVMPLNLDSDKYIRAVQVLPSNRRIAHHGVPILDGDGTARKLAAKYGSDHYPNFGGPGFIPRGFLPGYAPGMTIHESTGEVGITLSKGLDIVLQVHYHPIGREQTDQPSIGLYSTDKKPLRNPVVMLLGTSDVDIPAGAKAHVRVDTFKVPVDMQLRDIWGHMHMIGKKLHVWADLPDGSNIEMLRISDWDFNWQDTYQYAKPFVLPKDTVVNAEFTWDNSAENPRNPNNPPKRVRLGENSTDEMAGLIIGGMTVRPEDEGAMWFWVASHYLADLAKKPAQ